MHYGTDKKKRPQAGDIAGIVDKRVKNEPKKREETKCATAQYQTQNTNTQFDTIHSSPHKDCTIFFFSRRYIEKMFARAPLLAGQENHQTNTKIQALQQKLEIFVL